MVAESDLVGDEEWLVGLDCGESLARSRQSDLTAVFASHQVELGGGSLLRRQAALQEEHKEVAHLMARDGGVREHGAGRELEHRSRCQRGIVYHREEAGLAEEGHELDPSTRGEHWEAIETASLIDEPAHHTRFTADLAISAPGSDKLTAEPALLGCQ